MNIIELLVRLSLISTGILGCIVVISNSSNNPITVSILSLILILMGGISIE